MGKKKQKSPLTSRWRIVAMETWDKVYINEDVQHFAAAVQFRDGCRDDRVGYVDPVGQSPQYTGVDEKSHYSYKPSLHRAESGTDTPQSRAAPKSCRSQSS